MNNQSPLALSPAQTATQALEAMCYKLSKKPGQTFVMAMLAGMFIGMAFMFYATVTTGGSALPWGMSKLTGGLVFSMGLILVVLLGGELFTSTVMTMLAVVCGRSTFAKMAKNWLLVYSGNFVGAFIFSQIMLHSGHLENANFQVALNVMNIAAHKLHHTWGQALLLGMLCNIFVCLAVWISFAGRSSTDKILAMLFPVAAFVAAGFEHSIANMYMIPTGIGVNQMLTPEQWDLLGISASHFAELNWSTFITSNLIPVTIGNIFGGLIIALSFWWVFLRKPAPQAEPLKTATMGS